MCIIEGMPMIYYMYDILIIQLLQYAFPCLTIYKCILLLHTLGFVVRCVVLVL